MIKDFLIAMVIWSLAKFLFTLLVKLMLKWFPSIGFRISKQVKPTQKEILEDAFLRYPDQTELGAAMRTTFVDRMYAIYGYKRAHVPDSTQQDEVKPMHHDSGGLST